MYLTVSILVLMIEFFYLPLFAFYLVLLHSTSLRSACMFIVLARNIFFPWKWFLKCEFLSDRSCLDYILECDIFSPYIQQASSLKVFQATQTKIAVHKKNPPPQFRRHAGKSLLFIIQTVYFCGKTTDNGEVRETLFPRFNSHQDTKWSTLDWNLAVNPRMEYSYHG